MMPDMQHGRTRGQLLDRIEELEGKMKHIRAITDRQAEDEGLWFAAVTAPEAYLQQELRKLHSAIEAAKENQHE